MSIKKKLILFVLLFIALLFLLVVIYLVGYVKHIQVPDAKKLGCVNNFVFSYEGISHCNIVIVIKKGIVSENNSNYGTVNVVSSSGQKKCYDLSYSNMKKCNWISGIDNNTSESYVLFHDSKFSEMVKNGDIIFVKISSDILNEGIIWIYGLKPYKSKYQIKFITWAR